MPGTHRLAAQEEIDFADLLDEPFIALPRSAGVLRHHWLALDARAGRPARIGAECASADETYEALGDVRGVCLLAAGNAPLLTRGGVITRPVRGISTSRLALAWRAGDRRPLVSAYAEASRLASARHPGCRVGPADALAPREASGPVRPVDLTAVRPYLFGGHNVRNRR